MNPQGPFSFKPPHLLYERVNATISGVDYYIDFATNSSQITIGLGTTLWVAPRNIQNLSIVHLYPPSSYIIKKFRASVTQKK